VTCAFKEEMMGKMKCPRCGEELVTVGDLVFDEFPLLDDSLLPDPDFISMDFTDVSKPRQIINIRRICIGYECGYKSRRIK